jgi:hypothetical protein
MDRDYDIFEILPDGTHLWRALAKGLEQAHLVLRDIARGTSNEFYAIYMPSKEIVVRHSPHET